jgi:hypothetical protein
VLLANTRSRGLGVSGRVGMSHDGPPSSYGAGPGEGLPGSLTSRNSIFPSQTARQS